MPIRFGMQNPAFYHEDTAWPGVKRVTDWVRRDVERVIGEMPVLANRPDAAPQMVLVTTCGRSPLLAQLEDAGLIDLSQVRGKWEVFSLQLIEAPFPGVEQALVIAGSDKRGTIYGLLHLSELLGVSPLVDWAEVQPPRRSVVVLDASINMVSKEPSVRYRGIFLNDEWPALSTWATTRFGGFNAQMYAHVFELILRLKGNYLWPAMWKTNFSMEGPGLDSAILADELGVVMGNSHHEPCMRAGEEYSLMRGPDSPYGDAWNFRTNREGIIRFWEDGLKRNAPFENIITVGMRGEQDTAILGEHATLKDNVDLLRDVLHEQNRLIREQINPNLDEVQRLFVLFTEVEAFFYGNADAKGLMGNPELEGVTLMLSDDNFGNLRSLPTPEMRAHKGGCGLYYHLDFHGGAYAYDWMNTDYLPKMWEQLTTAWEGGVREVWIANIGDLCLLEYPLCYFMDLAYDMEKHGLTAVNATPAWADGWVQQQFGSVFSKEDCRAIRRVLDAYTHINHNRKPEVMNTGVYHPTHFGETQDLMAKAKQITAIADDLLTRCPSEHLPAFWELVYYPAAASANHCLLWLHATLNDFYAHQGRMEANDHADLIQQGLLRDRALTDQYHSIGNGRFYGMALSEHIGFMTWCEDGNLFPIMMRVEGANKPRLLVADSAGEKFTIGSRWSGNSLTIPYALHPGVDQVQLDLACGSREPVHYTVSTTCPWLTLSHQQGCVSRKDVLTITIDRAQLIGRQEGTVVVQGPNACYIHILAQNPPEDLAENTYLESNGIICMEAAHYAARYDAPDAAWVTLTPYGRTESAIKVLPPILDLCAAEDRPWVEYTFHAEQSGPYLLELYMGPSNTATMEHRLCFGLQVNGGAVQEVNGVGENFHSLTLSCMEWDTAVRSNIRIKTIAVDCRKGRNTLRLYGGSPLVVFERLILHPADKPLPVSYLGPKESYIKRSASHN